ncbi:hypothetical protein ACHAPQ_004140 [Fusarium lateritium]
MLPQGADQVALDKSSFQAEASDELQDLLVRLQSTTLQSSEEGLLGVNVSDRSRLTLSPAVMQLFDAPVYRLQLFCAPSNLQNVSIDLPDDHNPHLRIVLEESPVSELQTTKYQAEFGLEKSFLSIEALDNVNDTYSVIRYPLIAFDRTAIWIGSIRLNKDDGLVGMTATKRWGDLSPFTQSSTAFPRLAAQDNSYNLTFTGVTCHINRSTGRADVKVNGSDWSVIENTLFGEKFDQQYDIPMLSFASSGNAFDDDLEWEAPGLGGHLLRAALGVKNEESRHSWDLETLADVFLWGRMWTFRWAFARLLEGTLVKKRENPRFDPIDS